MPPNHPDDTLKAWLQLLRVPNLFTVPGDPLAGMCLAIVAGSDIFPLGSLLTVLAVSLLSYGSGLLQNDYFDLEEDRRERPHRPLPSKKVRPASVLLWIFIFNALALALAFFVGAATGITALVLAVTVTAYDYGGKRMTVVGPALMGVCRGLNLLLGATVLGWSAFMEPAVVVSALFLMIYIAAVTCIAADETEGYRKGALRWIPALTLTIWFAVLHLLIVPLAAHSRWLSLALAMGSIGWTLWCGNLLSPVTPPVVVQQTIGRFIRALLAIQATLALLAGLPGIVIGLGLLLAWPLSQRLARTFYAS